jgi:hypothetical protein
MAAQEITTPFATPERAANVLGVSKTRASKLIRWARTAAAAGNGEKTGAGITPNNGKGNRKAAAK